MGRAIVRTPKLTLDHRRGPLRGRDQARLGTSSTPAQKLEPPCSTDELLHQTAEKRSRLIEKAALLKRHLRQLAAELSACEGCIDELDRTERLLIRENMATTACPLCRPTR